MEYKFLCTALYLNEIYHPMKFHARFYSLGEMARTKKNMKINKGQLLKKQEVQSTSSCTLHFFLMRYIIL
jgi:hypothetical protein